MNNIELNSTALLKNLIENNGVVGIKTSFEDEGATFNEVLRLKELCNQAGTKLLLKIAGAEAKRDLLDSQIIGVKGIVAPMIESGFALDKFMKSVEKILPEDIISNLQLGINIETISAFNKIDEIINSDGFNGLYNITLGRVDFVSSMGKNRDYVNSTEMLDIASELFAKCRRLGKKLYLGGAITVESENFIKNLLSNGLLDKFETRYVMYDPTIALKNLHSSLTNGQKLELMILKGRQSFYLQNANKEIERINMIENRIKNG